MNANRKAFLDMLAWSEIGPNLLSKSDNGYNVIVGGELFDDYSDHPRKLVYLPSLKISSTAAGRYQVLARYFDAYKHMLGLKDFSPESQDSIALQQIKECHAIDNIDNGDIQSAINKCAHIWASLPGAGYNQHENKMQALLNAYTNAGGELSS